MDTGDSAARPSRAVVEVELGSPDVAVVTLRGEHDLTTKPALSAALDRASESACVLVDLAACAFLDSTVIGALVVASQRMWERDGRLELVIPADAHAIRRVAKIAGLAAFMAIHETRQAGLASLGSQS